MTDDEFKEWLFDEIKRPMPVQRTREILLAFKDGGGTGDKALEIMRGMLKEIRDSHMDEELEDSLLETMDIAAGFCSPQLLVWTK